MHPCIHMKENKHEFNCEAPHPICRMSHPICRLFASFCAKAARACAALMATASSDDSRRSTMVSTKVGSLNLWASIESLARSLRQKTSICRNSTHKRPYYLQMDGVKGCPKTGCTIVTEQTIVQRLRRGCCKQNEAASFASQDLIFHSAIV